ncbi:aminotran_1_2 domain-containing protein, partial [Haematococcus lacustris]
MQQPLATPPLLAAADLAAAGLAAADLAAADLAAADLAAADLAAADLAAADLAAFCLSQGFTLCTVHGGKLWGRRAVEQHQPKMVFLTSPNNPDGSMMTEEE